MSLLLLPILRAWSQVCIASWRVKYIGRKYFFLIVLLIVGAASDLISYFTILSKGSNFFNSNLYKGIEFILLVLLFKNWLTERKNKFHIIILVIGILSWVLDNIVFHSPFENTSIFRLVSSNLLILVIVDQINYVLFKRQYSLVFSELLICSGLILYHLCLAFIELFQIFPVDMGKVFFMKLWVIHSMLSLFTNLLISIAFICHQSKPKFSILS